MNPGATSENATRYSVRSQLSLFTRKHSQVCTESTKSIVHCTAGSDLTT